MNLANKYRPKTFEDVTEQGVTTEILNKLCKSEDLQLRNFLLTGPAGTGKAQPLYSKVLTPEGYIKMGEVTPGTKVIAEDGSTATVTDVYPQGDRHVWQINLRDKTSFRVADNHLNVVIDPYSGERKVMTTIELMAAVNSGDTLYIPLCAPIQKDYSHVSVNPYLLGQLIGVRNCAKPTDSIAVPFDKLDMCLQSFTKLSCDYGVTKYGERFAEIKFDAEDVTKKLATEGTDLTCIPKHYVYNSVIVREQLLQGIVDAIGTLFREYAAFMVTKPIDNLDLLIRSLGLYCEMQQNEPRQNYYLIEVNKDISVSSKPKSDYISIGRKITSIEYVGCEPCQCIMVDHPLHTYITDNFTVTHNTTSARIMANILNDGQGEPIEIDAASHSGVNDIREIVEQAQSYPVGSKYKVFIVDECHSISNAGFQVFLKCLESSPARSVFILCTTNPEKIPGTVLSRVQTFQLSKISLKGIQDRLVYVLEQEKAEGRQLTYDVNAVNYIAKLAQGGMRDALTSLDKCLAYSSDITMENVEKALNLPNYDDYFKLLNFIAKKDNNGIVSVINDVYDSGVNFIKWFDGFMAFISNIIKYIYIQDISATMIPEHYKDKIAGYGAAHAALCLKLSNKLVKLNQELRTTQYLQELAITYLCTQPAVK